LLAGVVTHFVTSAVRSQAYHRVDVVKRVIASYVLARSAPNCAAPGSVHVSVVVLLNQVT